MAQELMVTSLGHFLHTGDPCTDPSHGWEPVTADRECTMIMEEKPRLGINYDKELQQELIRDAERLGKGGGFSFATDI